MRLLIKFNLILILVFGSGVAVAGYLARNFLQQSAREQVLQQARLMMGSARAMRTHTCKQVGPLQRVHQTQINTFLAQTVLAYAATEAFNYMRNDYPAYTYKEATLNPTNLRDRALDWEADVIQTFRNHSEQKEFAGEGDIPAGRSLFLAKPIMAVGLVSSVTARPRKAPAAMTRTYGKNNGFDWKMGDTVGAQIISVPMSVPLGIADRAFRMMPPLGIRATLPCEGGTVETQKFSSSSLVIDGSPVRPEDLTDPSHGWAHCPAADEFFRRTAVGDRERYPSIALGKVQRHVIAVRRSIRSFPPSDGRRLHFGRDQCRSHPDRVD